MRVKLSRHALEDRPDWIIIDQTIPLGTEYDVLGFDDALTLKNPLYGTRSVKCYLVIREGGGPAGWLPAGCFDVV